MTMVLETDRLILREYCMDDWQAVHAYASDANLVQFMDWGPNSEDDTKNFIRAMMDAQAVQPRRNYAFIAELRHGGDVIGGCEIDVANDAQGSIGYCLNRRHWGQGYATELARALCRFGFDTLSLHRIFATCRPANVASSRVMEKIGMKREGLLREHFFAKSAWQNSFLYSLLVDEFREVQLEEQELSVPHPPTKRRWRTIELQKGRHCPSPIGSIP